MGSPAFYGGLEANMSPIFSGFGGSGFFAEKIGR